MDLSHRRTSLPLLAQLDAPAAEHQTQIAVVTDTHIGRGRDHYFRRAVADINERGVDAVAHLGDVSGDGAPSEFEQFTQIASDFDPPWYVIPGNHDVPKAFDDHETMTFDEFQTRVASAEFPFVERIGGVDLVGVNSAGGGGALETTHDGRVSSSDIEQLDAILSRTSNPVVAIHHQSPAMIDQYVAFRDATVPEHEGVPPVLRDPGPFLECLTRHDISLLLSGNLHIPAIASVRGITEVNAPSTQTFPQGYLLVTVGPSGTTVQLVNLATHDELRDLHRQRRTKKLNARVLTDMASIHLAELPLSVNEREEGAVWNDEPSA